MVLLLAAILAAPADPPAPPVPSPRPAAPVAARPAKPTRDQVVAAVRAEWPRYDMRHAGRLAPLEFSTWVMRANGVAMAAAGKADARGVKPVQAMNATARAFAVADSNHDGGVTPDEMVAFLLR